VPRGVHVGGVETESHDVGAWVPPPSAAVGGKVDEHHNEDTAAGHGLGACTDVGLAEGEVRGLPMMGHAGNEAHLNYNLQHPIDEESAGAATSPPLRMWKRRARNAGRLWLFGEGKATQKVSDTVWN
jgi:hypothetical protein